MTIDDVQTVNDFADYIVDSHYRDETCGYAQLMDRVEATIQRLRSNPNDVSDSWVDFVGDTVKLYRVIPYEPNRYRKDKETVSNVGMSWATSIDDLERVPWYDEHTTVLTVTIPTDDKTFIAFNNVLEGIVEVVLPNASKHYQVDVYRARRKRTKRLRRNN